MQQIDHFQHLVSVARDTFEQNAAPGAVVGISGTDSILSFLVCATAMKMLDRPITGVHFGQPWPPKGRTPEQIEKMLALSRDYNWVSRIIIPWLQETMPEAHLIINDQYSDDYHRWAELHRLAVHGPHPGWVIGTTNLTEIHLGLYSNISQAVSFQPLSHTWKSDVLAICEFLDVPEVASRHARQADCDCGRDDLAAAHIREIDLIIKCSRGKATEEELAEFHEIDLDLIVRLRDYVWTTSEQNSFKPCLPYKSCYIPSAS